MAGRKTQRKVMPSTVRWSGFGHGYTSPKIDRKVRQVVRLNMVRTGKDGACDDDIDDQSSSHAEPQANPVREKPRHELSECPYSIHKSRVACCG